jgi:hypothetical protein
VGSEPVAAAAHGARGTPMTGDAQPIRANSILPARREPLTLTTADGLDLVGELALPLDRAPVATLVCLHPLPTAGGMMDSHVLRKSAWRLPALAGLAVLRFNTRGTSSVAGTSEGTFDDGVAEGLDVAAALEAAEFADLPRVWLLGWSFGTELALVHGLDPLVVGGEHPRLRSELLGGQHPADGREQPITVEQVQVTGQLLDPVEVGAVLLSPPLHAPARAALPAWAADGRPLTALVPEFDDYLRPEAAREAFAAVPQAEVVGVDGARHLWVGHTERVLDEVVSRVVGPGPALPRTWSGPMEVGDASAYADRTVAALAATVEARRPPR